MPQNWQCSVLVTGHLTKLRIQTPVGDLLRARWQRPPRHPRALLTMLEGLSLWSGEPLSVVLFVDDSCQHWPAWLGEEWWPIDSPLVSFDIVPVAPRRGTGRLLGDFQSLNLAGVRKP